MTWKNMSATVAALRRGSFVVVVDDSNRENEGDLIIAAEHVTPETLAFMLRYTSGVVCVAITEARAIELDLPLMVPDNNESQRTAFTVSVDFRYGTTTGISAADRSLAIRGLADPVASASSFLRPGHVFPLRARPGGVLERRGHTEAAVDLMDIARLSPAGALCELTGVDGALLERVEVSEFAREHGFPLLSVGDIADYRRATEFRAPVSARTG
jgi:3,4-dihydroxy-2-butanone 4-phosphate synthase